MDVDTAEDEPFIFPARKAALTFPSAWRDEVRWFAVVNVVPPALGAPAPLMWSVSTACSCSIRPQVRGCDWPCSLATSRKADAMVRCRLIHDREQCVLIECSSTNASIVLIKLAIQSSRIATCRSDCRCEVEESNADRHSTEMTYDEWSCSSDRSI